MTRLNIGGVPEHFNLPIHLAKENGLFARAGLDIVWRDFLGGSGEMALALRKDEVDIAILLTEGIILDIINGNPSKIISEYITTPLCWGIHTSADSELSHHKEIYTKKYAISRIGSGSHLMAIIDANGENNTLDDSQFEVIGHLDGALTSLGKGETDVFYWEKFTTKPYVDLGKLKRIGEFPTPWPSFLIAATDYVLMKQKEAVITFLKVVHQICADFMKNDLSMIPLVASRYRLKLEDAENWYHRTGWAVNSWVSDKMISSVIYNLKLAKIIPHEKNIPDLIWKR